MYKQYKKTRKISKIKKSIVSALFLSGMLLLLTGCSHVTSEMKESRRTASPSWKAVITRGLSRSLTA